MRKRGLHFIFWGISSLLFLSCTPLFEPQSTQTSTSIVVQNQVEGVSSLLEIDLERSQRREIFQFSREQWLLSISPDRKYLILQEGDFLNLIQISNKELLTQLYIGIPTPPDFHIVKHPEWMLWSPTGQQFAFRTNTDTDLMLYDLPTNKLTNLTADKNRESDFVWSADGTEIAYVAIQACAEKYIYNCPISEHYWDIWSIDMATLEKTKWTDFSQKMIKDGDFVSNSLCQLVWSPDAQAIAFQSYCPSMDIHTISEFFVVFRNEPKQKQLTQFSHMDYVNYYTYQWSEDSQSLYVMYEHEFIFDDEKDEQGLWLVAQDASITSLPMPFDSRIYPPNIVWSENNFALGQFVLGRGMVVKIEGETFTPHITKNIPTYQQGVWLDGYFVVVAENKLYKIDVIAQTVEQIGSEFEGLLRIIE